MMGLLETAFQMLLQASSDMIFVKDTNLVYQAASMSFVTMVGKTSAEEIIGHTDSEIFNDSQLAKRYVLDDKKLLETKKDLLSFVEPIPDVDGQSRYGFTTPLESSVNQKLYPHCKKPLISYLYNW